MEELISFEDLGLDEATLAAVEKKGFETPSPIQVLAIPRLLEGDANVIAKARTGTGKTAAFGLPLVQTIRKNTGAVEALVLTPTRELALQVCKEIGSFSTGLYPRMTAIYGGQSMGEQLRALKKGVEIVVGTPGRVQDHLERGSLDLSKIKYFILDEADEMLDMGFIDDIEAIFSRANPDSRILLFSATMPAPILKIASKFMGEYEIVEEEATPETPVLTEQKYILVRERDKLEAVVRIIDISPDFYGLIFTQTKADADTLSRQLDERGYEVAALHGDISQMQREKILYRFRNKKTRILVATDVAARGIDIEGLTHVINYSLPFDSSTYIHRIGRTGRAGSYGVAITLVRPEERRKLDHLKSAIRRNVKGTLKEEKIPSVDTVLNAKRSRLFDTMKTSLQEKGEVSQESVFAKMASELCEQGNPEEVLASVLEVFYGKHLDAHRYSEILPIENPRFGGSGSVGANQTRLYVQLGRRDRMFPREIAEFFSTLLGIPQRLVDRIEVSDSFSLVSLPKDAAQRALQLSRDDRRLPHMHVDSKSEDFKDKGAKGRSGKNRHFDEGRSKKSSGYGKQGHRESFDGSYGSYGREKNRQSFASGKKRVEGGAALYKRKLPK